MKSFISVVVSLCLVVGFSACDDVAVTVEKEKDLNVLSEQNTTVSPLTALIFTTPKEISVKENQIEVVTLSLKEHVPNVTYSLLQGDIAFFNLNANSGRLTFKSAPDFENQTHYSLLVRAGDSVNNSSDLNLSITIEDVNETLIDVIAPVFKSPKDIYVYENETKVLTLSALDAQSAITYSIALGQSAASFEVDAVSGDVTFKEAPNFDTQSSYGFRAIARDEAGNVSIKYTIITILDLLDNSTDQTSPTFTPLENAVISVEENQLELITLHASDTDSNVTYTLSGVDFNSFEIDLKSGKVVFRRSPDYEKKINYSFIAIATDASGNSAEQTLSVEIVDVEEEVDDRNFIKTIDLEALAQAQGQSVGDYLRAQMDTTIATNFVEADKDIFKTDVTLPSKLAYIQDNWASHFDYSGISWNAIQAGTLITSQHMVLASHYQRSVGATVAFYTKDGEKVERTIVATRNLGSFQSGSDYDNRIFDAAIAKLNYPVPHSVKVYSIIDGQNAEGQKYSNELNNVPFVSTDQKRKTSLEEIKSLYSYTSYGHTTDSFIVTGGAYGAYAFMHHSPVSGDSGSPSFLYVDEEMVLLSTLSTAGPTGPFYGDNEFTKYLNISISEMELE